MRKLLYFAIVLIVFLALRKTIYQVANTEVFKLGFDLNNIADESYTNWIAEQVDDLSFQTNGIFLNKKINFQDVSSELSSNVLGENTINAPKSIEVSLKEQKLYMKEANNVVASFKISSGKWNPTPIGQWRIYTKLRYTRMRGGSKALGTFYDLPNVPYTMYYDRGYGIHGAYWHNDFGSPRSHGCINMKPEEAGIVFNWANVGTIVKIYN